MKKTVFAYGYRRLLRSKTPFQKPWTLLTTPTIRQSCRSFASSPVWHSCETSLGVSPCLNLLLVERRELAEAAAAAQHREQEIDHDRGDADAATAYREPAGRHPASADVCDLAGIELGSTPKAHAASLPAHGTRGTAVRPARSLTGRSCLLLALLLRLPYLDDERLRAGSCVVRGAEYMRHEHGTLRHTPAGHERAVRSDRRNL